MKLDLGRLRIRWPLHLPNKSFLGKLSSGILKTEPYCNSESLVPAPEHPAPVLPPDIWSIYQFVVL